MISQVRRISQLVLKREHTYIDTVGLGSVETPVKVSKDNIYVFVLVLSIKIQAFYIILLCLYHFNALINELLLGNLNSEKGFLTKDSVIIDELHLENNTI